MKNKILFSLFLCINIFLYPQSADTEESGTFGLFGLNFELAGDIRTRSAYLNNYDMDYDTSDGEVAWDVRGRINMNVTWGSPLYVRSLLEWGNVELTQDDLSLEDLNDLEMRELYLGYKNPSLKVKAGIIDMNTPGGYVYDSDEWGIQVKYHFDFMEAKAFYSAADLTEGSNESITPAEYMDNLIFLGLHQETYLNLDLWSMYYHGDTEDFTFNSCWLGIEASKKIEDFTVEGGYTYNFGEVVTYAIPLSAYFSHLKLEYEPDKRKTFFTRFNLTSGSEGSLDSTGQFQTLDGEGNLDTGLGLLFGGSSYSSQAYFDNESLSIVSDNLTDGSISFYDPGLLIYEFGFSYDFKDMIPLDLESEFILGAANTGDLFEGDGYFSSLIGWEADIHNRIRITEDLEFALSFSYLLAGNSFNAVYELNNDDETLDLADSSFMAGCRLKYSF